MKKYILIISILSLVIGLVLGTAYFNSQPPSKSMEFDEFITKVESQQVTMVIVYPENSHLTVKMVNSDQEFNVKYPKEYPLSQFLIEQKIKTSIEKPWYMKH